MFSLHKLDGDEEKQAQILGLENKGFYYLNNICICVQGVGSNKLIISILIFFFKLQFP
jgi:hypothetical protein